MATKRLLALLLAAAALAPAAHAQTRALVDGRDWQRSSMEERRAYLIGVSNAISVGARYDSRKAPGQNTFAVRAQTDLAGAQLAPAVTAIDDWYKTHPEQLDKPVLSVIWRELAKGGK
ncbi:hypothetical protein LJR219_004396 [Phenylobacterium sp. LjRoot219]|uniref:hypothetical protein n=1 Tax=Phenylobacterium sp. LjRoot219 TaxID=3342283 RepID=UPI003ED0AEC2